MIPSSSMDYVYVRLIGQTSLLGIAQSNLLVNLDRIKKVRMHVFLSNNAQTEEGVSRNEGAERFYSWNDTIIDCRNCPELIQSEQLSDLTETISLQKRFKNFRESLRERSNALLEAEPFLSIVLGENNMRYHIACDTKSRVQNFDMIRIGVKIFAQNEESYKDGLKALSDWENPYKIKSLQTLN